MVEILPFTFTASYFTQNYTAAVPSLMPQHSSKIISSSIVFPPVSLAVPTTVERPIAIPVVPVVPAKPAQKMFHCGNKTHDSLFVCFYVLKNNDAMLYHRDARRWSILERQHKIEVAATLRDRNNVLRLTDLFPKKGATKIGQIDDELTNQNNPTISIKTFISLCCIYQISIVLIDDDLRTMCILALDQSFPKHSVHIRCSNSCIMWDNDLDVLKQRTTGYATVSPTDVTFAFQLCENIVTYPKTKTIKTTTVNIGNDNELKAAGAYKLEELQAICIARDICCAKITGTGRGNKILKIDLYNSILKKMTM